MSDQSWLEGGEEWLDSMLELPLKTTPKMQESFDAWMESLFEEKRTEIIGGMDDA